MTSSIDTQRLVEEATQIRGVSVSGDMNLYDLHPYLPDDAYNAMLVYLVERAAYEGEKWVDMLLYFEDRRREFQRFYDGQLRQFVIPVYLFGPMYSGGLIITGAAEPLNDNQWDTHNIASWEVSVAT